MNYEIMDNKCISELIPKKPDIKPFLLLILSVIFIPAAYVFIAAIFIEQTFKENIKFNIKSNSCILYAYVLIGLISSDYKLISLIYIIIFMLCFYSFIVCKTSLELRHFTKIRNLIYIVSMFVFIIGILQYFNTDFAMPTKWVDSNEYQINKRIYSTFFNPNVFGFYINFIILYVSENLNLKKVNLEWIVFVSGIGCLILTFSRTAWISLIIALVAAGFFNKKYIKYALIISSAILITDALLGIGRVDPVKAVEDSSFLYRFEVWKACINIIKDNFLSGIGFGTLFMHIADYSTVVSTNIEHSHNLYLQVFTETGILGFSLFLTVIFNMIKKFHNKLKEEKNDIWITAFAIFTMTMTHGTVDSVSLTPQILLILSIYTSTLSVINNE